MIPPRCKCGARVQRYRGRGGFSVMCQPCNERNATRQRESRARLKARRLTATEVMEAHR
jgi:hypothetical protein